MGVILTILGLLAVGLLSTELVHYGEDHGWFLGGDYYHINKK